uniref:TBC1 domain family member 13 n=1 Tax=Rhinolophus ferrumequinum TaxID=59479 RepID=A0A671GAK4_RHIFE
MSSLHKSRIADFQDVLKEPTIALEKLRELSFSGIPCEGGLRCLCWKILLNYLPLERASWTSILAKQRELYSQFLREMIIQPGIAKANMGVSREDVTFEDHPLNPNPDSRWNTYFKDNEVLLQIDKDVRRLCPDISFFQRATEYPCLLILDPQNEFETLRKRVEQTTLKSQTVARNRSGVTNMSSPHKNLAPSAVNEYQVLPSGCEAHWEVVERILFIYAKLNPGIAYVQGMNEIVGPLYYTFATDPNNEWKEHAEADTFFCFTNLMAEIRDNFIKSLDDSQCGITYKMEKVYSTLKDKDVELYLKLVRTPRTTRAGRTEGRGRGQLSTPGRGELGLRLGIESGHFCCQGALTRLLRQDWGTGWQTLGGQAGWRCRGVDTLPIVCQAQCEVFTIRYISSACYSSEKRKVHFIFKS